MQVFISWSGERSKKVAELLNDWLQCVIQAVTPWMSSKDIDRGALWFPEITDQLANTSIGIVCLTKENRNKPWILFESGALAKGLTTNRVCTFLIDLASTDLENPLAQFNHTFPTRDSIWELIRTINLSLKEKSLKESVLEKVFETYWSQFETEFQGILKKTPECNTTIPVRNDNDIMLDVLSTVRLLEKRLRNIEVNNDKENYIQVKDNGTIERGTFRIAEVKNQIRELIAQDTPDDLIISKLAEKLGLPRAIIKREVFRVKDTMLNDNG